MDENLTGEDLLKAIESNERMTPQEKLHAKLFYHETIFVKDMEPLTLRAHIEELSSIAFEARSRLGAATAEEDKRKKAGKKQQGFERSLNTDETTSNAINVIKERQKKLTKAEKIQEGLKSLYTATAEAFSVPVDAKGLAEKAMSARTMAPVVNKAQNTTPLPAAKSDGKAVFNPFARKKEQEQNVQAAINEVLNGNLAKPEPQAPTGKIINPFAKKGEA